MSVCPSIIISLYIFGILYYVLFQIEWEVYRPRSPLALVNRSPSGVSGYSYCYYSYTSCCCFKCSCCYCKQIPTPRGHPGAKLWNILISSITYSSLFFKKLSPLYNLYSLLEFINYSGAYLDTLGDSI